MPDETHDPQETEAVAADGDYATSSRTKYILIGVIIVLAFAVSYGIAQTQSGASDQVASESGTVGLATTAGSAQAAGGG